MEATVREFYKSCQPFSGRYNKQMKFGLTNSAQEILVGIFEKYPQVAHVIIYGSRAKGTFANRSDLD